MPSPPSCPGVATAFSDSTPVLLLPLGHPRDRAQVFPLFSSARTYASVTRAVETLHLAAEVSEVMRRAFNCLKNDRPGRSWSRSRPMCPWRR
jgi:acetolactate synthase-1/2/3 large subunit